LGKFISETRHLTAEERGKHLENDTHMAQIHEEICLEGQTSPPEMEENTDLHFVTFIERQNFIYKLDGLESGPTIVEEGSHGPIQKARQYLLVGTCRWIRKNYMDQFSNMSENIPFLSVLALVKCLEN
jgi:hypothetical protein